MSQEPVSIEVIARTPLGERPQIHAVSSTDMYEYRTQPDTKRCFPYAVYNAIMAQLATKNLRPPFDPDALYDRLPPTYKATSGMVNEAGIAWIIGEVTRALQEANTPLYFHHLVSNGQLIEGLSRGDTAVIYHPENAHTTSITSFARGDKPTLTELDTLTGRVTGYSMNDYLPLLRLNEQPVQMASYLVSSVAPKPIKRVPGVIKLDIAPSTR